MKYEMIFGNKDLFDGAGTFTGLDVVVHSIASGIKSYARLSDLTPESLRNHPVCAMRRIIAEPKRWTMEDQKASRMPEVDWVVRATGMNEDARIAAINNDSVCVVFEDGAFVTLHVSGIAPIETPEEKAERLRSEWCSECTSKYYPRGHKGFPEMIYDALLSGTLSAPTKGGE